MLPARHRLRRPEEFRATVRGRHGDRRLPRGRAGGELMMLHLVRRPPDDPAGSAARVGFVVSKAVGHAARRNRTQRRLRHIARHHLERLPAGGDLVVRAHPAAATASFDQLDLEFERLLTRALRALGPDPRSAA